MTLEEVAAHLAEVVDGTRVPRRAEDDIVVFDSTGVAVEDAAAADLAFERALALGLGRRLRFGA